MLPFALTRFPNWIFQEEISSVSCLILCTGASSCWNRVIPSITVCQSWGGWSQRQMGYSVTPYAVQQAIRDFCLPHSDRQPFRLIDFIFMSLGCTDFLHCSSGQHSFLFLHWNLLVSFCYSVQCSPVFGLGQSP